MTMLALAPITGSDLAVQAAKTVIIVVVVAAGLRLFGKREMAQLNVYDLAMLMAASNAVQNAMTGGRGNLSVGLVCSATVIAVGAVATKAFARHSQLEARLVGNPVIVVRHGHVLVGRRRTNRVTGAELDAAIREHGLSSVKEVDLAVLEVDGSLSIVAMSEPDSSPE